MPCDRNITGIEKNKGFSVQDMPFCIRKQFNVFKCVSVGIFLRLT